MGSGLDAGSHTIAWHLVHQHGRQVAAATVSRYLTARGLVTPDPKKKPKSAFLTFAAEQPNECWQSDFTHYQLTRPDGRPGADSEILTWLDDHARYALRVTGHVRVTGPIVLEAFRGTYTEYGIPASTLTDIQSGCAALGLFCRPAEEDRRRPAPARQFNALRE